MLKIKIQELDSLIKYKNLKVVVDSTSKYLKDETQY